MECLFSIAHYLETINAYRDNGYHIGPVSDFFHNRLYDKQILLRHDVDLSLDYALDMALLEKDNNIHATYYILLHSDLYDALSPKGTERVRAIKEAGHEIGLHVDTRYYMGSMEFSILSEVAQTTVSGWAQHLINITPQIPKPMSYNARDTDKGGYKYLSDSGMHWKEGCWCNHINKYDKFQILIHPEWTVCSPSGKRNKYEILEDIKEETKGQITNSFRSFRDMVQEYMQVVTA